MNKKFVFIFISILIFAAVLRFIELDRVPPALSQDEAATGVDAYYIGETGKDHHGNKPGVMLETFGDYVSPLQTYLAIPVVKTWGLSETTIRSSAAFWGTLTILIVMLFAYDVGKRIFYTSSFKHFFTVAAGFIFTISSWHIIMVRWALPSGLVPLFMLLTTWFIFKAYWSDVFRSRLLWGILSAFSAGLAVYAYPTMKLFMPIYYGLLLSLLFVIPRTTSSFTKILIGNLKKNWIPLLASGVIFSLIIIPLFVITLQDSDKYQFRYEQVSIWNKEQNGLLLLVSNYISYLSNTFLFNVGDADAMRMMPFSGALGYGLLIPFYAGLITIVSVLFEARWVRNITIYTSKFTKTFAAVLLFWLFISPLPASLTVDQLHSFRVIQMMPAVLLITALGLTTIIAIISNYVENKWMKLGILLIIIFPLLENFIAFSFVYYGYVYRDFVKPNFQYGVKESILFSESQSEKYDKVIVDRSINTPYIYVLFYTKPDLSKTQVNITKPEKGGWNDAKQIGKYFFEEVDVKKYAQWESHPVGKYDLCAFIKQIEGGEHVVFNIYDCPDRVLLIDKVDIKEKIENAEK